MKPSQQMHESSNIIIPIYQWKKCKLREVLECGQSCTAKEGTEPSNQNQFLWLWKPLSFHYTICLPILHGDNVAECCHACGATWVVLHFPGRHLFSPSRLWSKKGPTLTRWASVRSKMPDRHFRKTGKVRYAYHQFIFGSFSGKMKAIIPSPSLGHCRDLITQTTSKNLANAEALINVRGIFFLIKIYWGDDG